MIEEIEKNPRGSDNFKRIRESSHFFFLHFWNPLWQDMRILKHQLYIHLYNFVVCFNDEKVTA